MKERQKVFHHAKFKCRRNSKHRVGGESLRFSISMDTLKPFSFAFTSSIQPPTASKNGINENNTNLQNLPSVISCVEVCVAVGRR
jgi:hypothetical protein